MIITFRVTFDQRRLLLQDAAIAGLSQSDYIRFKLFPASQETHQPALCEPPPQPPKTMCDRCLRVGKIKDCEACKELVGA